MCLQESPLKDAWINLGLHSENHALIKRPSDVALFIGDSFKNLNIIEADDYKKSGNKWRPPGRLETCYRLPPIAF